MPPANYSSLLFISTRPVKAHTLLRHTVQVRIEILLGIKERQDYAGLLCLSSRAFAGIFLKLHQQYLRSKDLIA
jgi:hypothetical protein